MQDKTMKCKDCGKDFVWTAGEQQFYQDKGFSNPPSRCADCRKANKNASFGGGGGGNRGPRQDFPITCSKCGKADTVPFQPKGPDVLCRDCFKASKGM